jgi:intracellular sulfur oxidation DsrE/DsrF family protein
MNALRVAFACLIVPTLLTAQTSSRPAGSVITHPNATYTPVPAVDFPGDTTVTYRFAWALAAAADSAHRITSGFLAPARVFNTLTEDGVAPERVHLAIVARGPAAIAMLDNAAYQRRFGIDNPNLPLLRELHERGVLLVVCGQTVMGNQLARADFPDFVQLSRAATVAKATLAARGYVFNPF